MTECERLIENGTFSPDFFKEEIRSDFLVTTERKKIWAIQIDLALQLDRVCQKYGLQYFLFFGSLLGAVRHKGYIPWDNDFDVCLPRNDYDKLLGLAHEFCAPYFFQTPHTDKGHAYCHIQIRNSNTAGIIRQFMYQGFNLGIGIDVLALDAFENSEQGRETFAEINRIQRDNSTFMRTQNPSLSESDRIRVREYLSRHRDPINDYERYNVLAKSFSDSNCDTVCCTSASLYGWQRDIFAASDFKCFEKCPYEGFCFPIPNGYDSILKTIYGDYMTLPPIEERGLWHGTTDFHPDEPYTKFIMSRSVPA